MFVHHMSVDSAYRRRGVGSALHLPLACAEWRQGQTWHTLFAPPPRLPHRLARVQRHPPARRSARRRFRRARESRGGDLGRRRATLGASQ